MGQIFFACAYDIETMTSCVVEADKFDANCYAHNGAVLSMHYLLRHKPYRIMWGGDYVESFYIAGITRTEDLLGISTYIDTEIFDTISDYIPDESCNEKIALIKESSRLWETIDVWDEALKYFDYEHTKSVKYSGYLINHTKKLAVSLEHYYGKSIYRLKDIYTAIDPVPMLTDTSGGYLMALLNGVTM